MADNNVVIPGSIGYFLIKGNIITEEQLAEALEIQSQEKGLLGQILVDKGKVSRIQAERKAEREYEQFNKTQKIESDFDRVVKKLKK